jgi:GTP cyclohydrolase I
VIKAWKEMTRGYEMDPKDLVRTFAGEGYNEMVSLGPIRFYSTCEHHLLPFFGHAWVAYIPNTTTGKIIGLSKLVRLVEIFSRRLQVQERLTAQIADTLTDLLNAHGSACLIEAQHFCMMCRGVGQSEPVMRTNVLRGVFYSNPQTRAEFLALCRK